MTLALNNLKRVDMPLNKEINQSIKFFVKYRNYFWTGQITTVVLGMYRSLLQNILGIQYLIFQ